MNYIARNVYLAIIIASLGMLTGCGQPETPPAAIVITPTKPIIASLPPDTITGNVSDEHGAVSGATVRIQATQNATTTDAEGHFILSGLTAGEKVTVSAWKEGYYCAFAQDVLPPANQVKLDLRPIQTNDNPDYEWVPPTGNGSCYSCKPGVTQVWLDNDAHGKSAVNPRFLSMYNGTDVQGNQSPPTQYITVKDYGTIPLQPDLSKPYYGPGYKLDFPQTAGNCAACHTPGAAIADPYGTDPNEVSGTDTFGVHCDFCHKIADVALDPQTNIPYQNMPGVLSMDIRRPFPEDEDRYQLFFGTFDDDNVPMEDTRLPLIEQSQFCASCHYGVFWDTVVYNSYGEWLESAYSDPSSGKTCQQCHMPGPTILNGEALTNVAPGKGGVERDPATIHAHTFPGAANVELLQNSVTLAADAKEEGGQVNVTVSITNDQTGHHVPTDSPLRHLILLVEASDGQGKLLAQTSGDVLPEWCGEGDPQEGNYAGLPGKTYAKLLQELWTEIYPSGSYWNHTRIISDNRLAAFATDTSRYTFKAPASGNVTIKIRLLYRRAFIELMKQKGWDTPDILMEEKVLEIE